FPIFAEEAARSMRSARAIRPCLPITLPMSPCATRSSTTTLRSTSEEVTSTASGASTRARARNRINSSSWSTGRRSLGLGLAFREALGDLQDRHARTSALADPVVEPRRVEDDGLGRAAGVIGADALDEGAVALLALIRHHDAVIGRLRCAETRKPDRDCHDEKSPLARAPGRGGRSHSTGQRGAIATPGGC